MLDSRYAAGLFDGEGYVRINRWAKPNSAHVRYSVFVGIGMTFRPVIEALQATYGGAFSVNRHSLKNPNHRDQFVWNVASRKACAFLSDIHPYLIVKRDEAELALELQRSIDEWKHRLGNQYAMHERRAEVFAHREALYHRISALKHRVFSHVVERGPS